MDADPLQTPPEPAASGVSAAPQPSLRRVLTWRRAREGAIRWVLFICAFLSIVTSAAIVFVLLFDSVLWFPWWPEHKPFFATVSLREFLTETRWTPQYSDKHFGILPLLLNTLLITVIAAVIGLPTGLASAVYLSEYATPAARSVLKPVLEILAGMPTVVLGFFALYFITPLIIMPVFHEWLGLRVESFNALSGGIVVGLMIVPVVASLSEDVLRSVPTSLREAGYALGSTKFDVSVKVVVPSALSGILASFLLALSRAIGETMAVTIASGSKPQMTVNPLVQIQTMTSFVVNVMKGDAPMGSIELKSIYAVALVLFLITLGMNYVSQLILSRFREVYQ
jgi:phosphate transport system permease protein